jgi:polar amino acid transport system substrate-binding protein
MRTWIATLVLVLSQSTAQAAQPELTFLAPTNHMMPFVSFQDGELSGGFIKDISDVLAQRLGYKARFHTVPGKRVALALTRHDADGECFVIPAWIDDHFNWSRPAIPAAGAIVAHTNAPAIKALESQANELLGTVLGYRYPELDTILGDSLLRDDAPSVQHTLAKLAAGRTRYAVVDKMTTEHYLRAHPTAPLRIAFTYVRFKASCTFSLASPVRVAEVVRVLGEMVEDGTIDGIMARYR